jgi:hypothetical protein
MFRPDGGRKASWRLMPYRYEATEKFWTDFYDLRDSQKESVRALSCAPRNVGECAGDEMVKLFRCVSCLKPVL